MSNIDAKTLRDLSALQLDVYAGNIGKIFGEDGIIEKKLTETPVRAKVIAQEKDCDAGLYRVGLEIQGEYKSFKELRRAVVRHLQQLPSVPGSRVPGLNIPISPEWNLISVLFDGIYIGEPEDLLNHWTGTGNIFTDIKGLGEKLAEIEFLKAI